MSSIRDLGSRINSLKNMQKVMRAMNMISSIKLRKLNQFQDSLTIFTKAVNNQAADAAAALSDISSPAVSGFEEVSRIHVVLFTGDKGLCGTHNSSVQRALEKFMAENRKKTTQVEVTAIGNKGIKFCKRKEYEIFQQSEIGERIFTQNQLKIFSDNIVMRFLGGTVQQIFTMGNTYYSTLRQETEVQQLLPLKLPGKEGNGNEVSRAPFYVEPEGLELAEAVTRRFVYFKLQSVLLHSYLSEHSARMTAMENATSNSEDLIQKYVSMQNHARQAAITNELIEIISGKEAL